MKITQDSDELLVVRFTRWKGPLTYAILSLIYLGAAALLVMVANVPNIMLFAWLAATVFWMVPVALLRVEKSMLILNATTGEAELRHRDIWGTHNHTWPLSEVQSTRVTRYSKSGPADKDPKRLITLYVRDGMDEGKHLLAKNTVPAADALEVSARVSSWMKDWRKRVDSVGPQA